MGAGLSFGLGRIMTGLGRNMDQNSLNQQQLDLEKEQLKMQQQWQNQQLEIGSQQEMMNRLNLMQQMQLNQQYQLAQKSFLQNIQSDPSMASLKPLAPMIAAMPPDKIDGFLNVYMTAVQKANDRKATADAYHQMAMTATDQKKRDAWLAASTMATGGSDPKYIAPVLKSAGITDDDATDSLRRAQALLAESNAQLAKVQAAWLDSLKPGAGGGGPSLPTTLGMPPGAPPLPPGIPSGGTFGGGTP